MLDYLGKGGFGKVFKIKDRNLNGECALKILNIYDLAEDSDEKREMEYNMKLAGLNRPFVRCCDYRSCSIHGYYFIGVCGSLIDICVVIGVVPLPQIGGEEFME